MAYSILFKQCGSDHMTRGRSRAIDRIVVHFTATLASARNNATYFARNEGQGASAHYFVDDITPEIYQSVAEGDTAWHAGDWQMNCRAIGIEVVSAGEDFSATEVEKLGWLVRKLMAKYGIGASGVIRHYDVTGKLCPRPFIDEGAWADFKKRLEGEEMTCYKTIGDVPADYRPAVQKLLDAGALKGYGDGTIQVSEDLCRTAVILDRLGLVKGGA